MQTPMQYGSLNAEFDQRNFHPLALKNSFVPLISLSQFSSVDVLNFLSNEWCGQEWDANKMH